MDGPNNDHSDSDSGESWTLLEDAPAYADEALEYCEGLPKQKGDTAENIDKDDKDEDTDGISIITDSEPESMPCEITYETTTSERENRLADNPISQFISVNPYPNDSNNELNESVRSEDDLLGDSSGKLKTYVHRRNKRLSTVLNIIVLGSVITAAGVAIGHMWGVRDDCSMHTTPSVNKILSNLYKLQEENAYLRNKLKELTLLNNIQSQQRKAHSDKVTIKQPRCKKMFEEPLNNRNVNKLTKCLDNDNSSADKLSENHALQPDYEKGFLNDVDKLKHVYMQNRSWLDEAIARRLKNEKQQAIRDIKVFNHEQKKNELNNQQKKENTIELANINKAPNNMKTETVDEVVIDKKSAPEKKISYADSLRSDKDNETKQTVKRDNLDAYEMRRDYRKKKPKKMYTPVEISISEEEFKKDDRYMAPKHKQERKKHDRQHSHKKQKRKDKYEQWEIKSGYMKDYDEYSVTSSQENDFILKNPDKNVLSRDFERNSYIDQFSEANDNIKSTQTLDGVTRKSASKKEKISSKRKDKDSTWYEKRALQRTEARKKLENELFGDTSPSTAAWYFKRMQKREQCRVRGDNSTHRKLSKRNMNFKLKH